MVSIPFYPKAARGSKGQRQRAKNEGKRIKKKSKGPFTARKIIRARDDLLLGSLEGENDDLGKAKIG